MSHEMAALLLTECIQNFLDKTKPIYVLYLDAKSAFDKALYEILGHRLYLDGTRDQNLAYILNDLKIE